MPLNQREKGRLGMMGRIYEYKEKKTKNKLEEHIQRTKEDHTKKGKNLAV